MMKIVDSVTSMTGESIVIKNYTKEESLRAWVGKKRPDFEGSKLLTDQPLKLQVDVVELSDQAKAMLAQEKGKTGVAQAGGDFEFEISMQDEQKILLIERMIEDLTGKKLKFHILKKLRLDTKSDINSITELKNNLQTQQQLQGWGLEYDRRESYYEQEKMSFTAQGMIKTADGREINFSVQLNMSREFAQQQNISIRAGDAVKIDPLVINFAGSAPQLTSNKFSFDLDLDGKEDQISFIGNGSGFLAIDLNGDGQVNNGGELFGPVSGDGFSELAKYDEDGNQWIDENDSIYDRLRIWTKDPDGKDVLFALGQKGIGAIFLGNINTPFDMKDGDNKLHGQVRDSGIFLRENGSAGTIQQIDLIV